MFLGVLGGYEISGEWSVRLGSAYGGCLWYDYEAEKREATEVSEKYYYIFTVQHQ